MQTTVERLPSPDQHICSRPRPTEHLIGQSTATSFRRGAIRHHDHQIIIAVRGGIDAGLRAEKVNPFGLIRLYQRTLSRLLPPVCRFTPSCSQYAVQALELHGLWHGSRLALRRLAHCHPFHPGGHDPVPPPRVPAAPGAGQERCR